MALIGFLTLILQVVKFTSDVTYATLSPNQKRKLAEIKCYLERQAKLTCAESPKEE